MTHKEHLIKRPNVYLPNLDPSDFHYLYEVLEEESESTISKIIQNSFSSESPGQTLESYLTPKILLKKRNGSIDNLLYPKIVS